MCHAPCSVGRPTEGRGQRGTGGGEGRDARGQGKRDGVSVPCNMRANCWHSVVRSVARKEGQGRVREDEQTRGRPGPGARAERV